MGQGQYFNTFTPYFAPQMPFNSGFLSNPQISFGGTYPFNQQMPFGMGLPFTNTSTESTVKTEEEKKKKAEMDKAAADFLKRMELITQHAEEEKKLNDQIKDLKEGKQELYTTIDKANKGKKTSDGTIKLKETWEDYNKLPWWKKGLRAAGAMFMDAPMKLAEGFVGYEHNPKTGESEWNWKKGLRNAAIAAGCIALTAIPVAGPIISAGLLATGAVCGTAGAVKGIHNAVNAKTPEELEQAYQDIGTGVLIGAASVAGLRGLGKSAQVSAASSNTASAVETSWKTSVAEFFKDTTVNAYKATVQSVKTQKSVVAANGFWKTFGTNLKETIPFGKSKFENASHNTNQSINTRLNEINRELNNTNLSPLKKTLLEQEKLVLDAQKAELRGAVTKEGWNALKTNSEVHKDINTLQSAVKEIKTNGSVTIDGKTFNMSKDNLKALQEALSRSKQMAKEIQTLAKTRKSTIRQMAYSSKNKADVEAYTGTTRSNRIGRLYDTVKINKSDITWKKALMSPFKFAWEAMMLAWKPWNSLKNSPATTVYKAEETIAPSYSAGFLSSGIIAETMDMGEKTMTTKILAKDENGDDIEQIVPVTEETLAQIKEEIKQYDEAIAKVQEQISQLYVV